MLGAGEVLESFRRTGALLEGHFVLTSGLHSTVYLQCALVLQHPPEAEAFGRAIAEHFRGERVETVVAPAIGGIVIGWEVARALKVRSLWTERVEGKMTLRRGSRCARARASSGGAGHDRGSTRETVTRWRGGARGRRRGLLIVRSGGGPRGRPPVGDRHTRSPAGPRPSAPNAPGRSGRRSEAEEGEREK